MDILKLATKALIKDAALHHNMRASELVKLWRGLDTGGPRVRLFVEAMCPDVKDQPTIDRYTLLYHMIDNFYIRGAQSFEELSMYPRVEDLFASSAPPEEDFKSDSIPWNKQQRTAFKEVFKWLRTPKRKQIFRLFGWAGTGKTVMAKRIEQFVINEAGKRNVPAGGIIVSAYTGKACSVLRTKGFRTADTLHSLLYKPEIDPDTGRCVRFVLNPESPLATCALLIVDEVSMVNEDMAADVLSFGCSILVLGDPEQLPPVEGTGFFMDAEPEIMLSSVERQAKENPIIYLATRARKGLTIKPGKYGDSVVHDIGFYLDPELYAKHDQILCGTNNTRKTLNKKVRRYMGFGAEDPNYPVKGEKLICLRNNRNKGLYNGTTWQLQEKPTIEKIKQPLFKGSTQTREGKLDVLRFVLQSLDERDANGNLLEALTQCSPHHFNDSLAEPSYRELVGSDDFFFGHAITTHKAQGSQWEKVLLVDESSTFRDMRHRHRYTGITRAASSLTLLL